MSEFPDPDYKHFSICKKCENGTACQLQLYEVLSAMDMLFTKKNKPLI
jgi:hypothetical protein